MISSVDSVTSLLKFPEDGVVGCVYNSKSIAVSINFINFDSEIMIFDIIYYYDKKN
jgi:hypothetical protein